MSLIIGYTVLVVMILLVLWIFVYPELRKGRVQTRTPRLRQTPVIFDDKYGLCKVDGGQPLDYDSFKLHLTASNGQSYKVKYFKGEIMPYTEYNCLVGSGNPVWITKRAHHLMESEGKQKVNEIDVIKNLKDELQYVKAQSRISINDPDEKVRNIVTWISQLEVARARKISSEHRTQTL